MQTVKIIWECFARAAWVENRHRHATTRRESETRKIDIHEIFRSNYLLTLASRKICMYVCMFALKKNYHMATRWSS